MCLNLNVVYGLVLSRSKQTKLTLDMVFYSLGYSTYSVLHSCKIKNLDAVPFRDDNMRACLTKIQHRYDGYLRRGAARLARLHGVQEVGVSNPLAPTDEDSILESFFLHSSEVSLRGTHAANTPSGYTSSRPDQERFQQLNLFFFPKALKSITTLRFRNQ